MAVRSTMASLITRTRSVIGDPAGASQTFADQDVQDALDEFRFDVRQAPLNAQRTINVGGGVVWTDYYAGVPHWEDDLILQTGSWATVTPASTDNITGHYTFANSGAGQIPPLFVTGKFYDVYRSGSELVRRRASLHTGNYDFSADGQTFRRSQAYQIDMQLAEDLLRHAYSRTVRLTRGDIFSDMGPVGIQPQDPDQWGW